MEFYYVTVRESKKFTAITKRILADAKKYSFNYDSIKLYTTLICFEAIQDINKANKHYIVLNSNGWAIILDMPNFVEVKYIFVYPDNRRTGFFTQLLTLLKRQKKEVSVCTCEPIMLRALVARGFQFKGRSLCGTELAYILPIA
jgi:GNAT superfamily N-acetyltransferase